MKISSPARPVPAGNVRSSRRAIALLLVLLCLATGAFGCAAPPAESSLEPAQRLILIVIDTCRRDALTAYAPDAAAVTPNLQTFAENAVLFERAIATSSWTLPSVASMLTSQMPTIHGAYGKGRHLTSLRDGTVTGATRLREQGWRTGAVVNAPFLKPRLGLEAGFEQYDYFGASADTTRRAGPSVDAALRQLEVMGDEPSFLLLHLFDPHLPYDPPVEYAERARGDYAGEWQPPLRLLKRMRSDDWAPTAAEYDYLRRVYQAEVDYVDAELGRFFAALRERGWWDDSFVVVTVDHGEEFGEHGAWEHGHSMYAELVHVPLFVKPPASWAVARSVVAAQVSLLDLMPTLFAAGGLVPTADFAGESFVEMMTAAADPTARVAESERVHLGSEQFAWRTAEWALLYWEDDERVELYDVIADPEERNDLAAERPEITEALREQLLDAVEAREALAETLPPRERIGPGRDLVERLKSLGYGGE